MLDILARFQFFIYPLAVHLSVVFKVPFVIASLLPVFYFILARPFSGTKNQIMVKSGILLLLSLIGLISWSYLDHSIIYLPPVLMILTVLYPFVRSIMPGRTPLITRFYQLTKAENDPGVNRYTRNLTWVWIVLIMLMLINTLILTLFAPLAIWSLFTNFIHYVVLLSMLILEWLFRIFWFKQWQSPIEFARQLLTLDQRELFRS